MSLTYCKVWYELLGHLSKKLHFIILVWFQVYGSSVYDLAMAIEDRGPQIAAVGILFLTLPWIAVSLRCYVRTCIMKSFGSDDWLSVASLVRFPNI